MPRDEMEDVVGDVPGCPAFKYVYPLKRGPRLPGPRAPARSAVPLPALADLAAQLQETWVEVDSLRCRVRAQEAENSAVRRSLEAAESHWHSQSQEASPVARGAMPLLQQKHVVLEERLAELAKELSHCRSLLEPSAEFPGAPHTMADRLARLEARLDSHPQVPAPPGRSPLRSLSRPGSPASPSHQRPSLTRSASPPAVIATPADARLREGAVPEEAAEPTMGGGDGDDPASEGPGDAASAVALLREALERLHMEAVERAAQASAAVQCVRADMDAGLSALGRESAAQCRRGLDELAGHVADSASFRAKLTARLDAGDAQRRQWEEAVQKVRETVAAEQQAARQLAGTVAGLADRQRGAEAAVGSLTAAVQRLLPFTAAVPGVQKDVQDVQGSVDHLSRRLEALAAEVAGEPDRRREAVAAAAAGLRELLRAEAVERQLAVERLRKLMAGHTPETMEACFRAHAAQIDANIAERLHAVDTAISEAQQRVEAQVGHCTAAVECCVAQCHGIEGALQAQLAALAESSKAAVARLGVVEGEVQRQASVGAAQQETLQARLAKLEDDCRTSQVALAAVKHQLAAEAEKSLAGHGDLRERIAAVETAAVPQRLARWAARCDAMEQQLREMAGAVEAAATQLAAAARDGAARAAQAAALDRKLADISTWREDVQQQLDAVRHATGQTRAGAQHTGAELTAQAAAVRDVRGQLELLAAWQREAREEMLGLRRGLGQARAKLRAALDHGAARGADGAAAERRMQELLAWRREVEDRLGRLELDVGGAKAQLRAVRAEPPPGPQPLRASQAQRGASPAASPQADGRSRLPTSPLFPGEGAPHFGRSPSHLFRPPPAALASPPPPPSSVAVRLSFPSPPSGPHPLGPATSPPGPPTHTAEVAGFGLPFPPMGRPGPASDPPPWEEPVKPSGRQVAPDTAMGESPAQQLFRLLHPDPSSVVEAEADIERPGITVHDSPRHIAPTTVAAADVSPTGTPPRVPGGPSIEPAVSEPEITQLTVGDVSVEGPEPEVAEKGQSGMNLPKGTPDIPADLLSPPIPASPSVTDDADLRGTVSSQPMAQPEPIAAVHAPPTERGVDPGQSEAGPGGEEEEEGEEEATSAEGAGPQWQAAPVVRADAPEGPGPEDGEHGAQPGLPGSAALESATSSPPSPTTPVTPPGPQTPPAPPCVGVGPPAPTLPESPERGLSPLQPAPSSPGPAATDPPPASRSPPPAVSPGGSEVAQSTLAALLRSRGLLGGGGRSPGKVASEAGSSTGSSTSSTSSSPAQSSDASGPPTRRPVAPSAPRSQPTPAAVAAGSPSSPSRGSAPTTDACPARRRPPTSPESPRRGSPGEGDSDASDCLPLPGTLAFPPRRPPSPPSPPALAFTAASSSPPSARDPPPKPPRLSIERLQALYEPDFNSADSPLSNTAASLQITAPGSTISDAWISDSGGWSLPTSAPRSSRFALPDEGLAQSGAFGTDDDDNDVFGPGGGRRPPSRLAPQPQRSPRSSTGSSSSSDSSTRSD